MTRYWPLGTGREIESPFGPRDGGFHSGVDFGKAGGSAGLPVYACQSGTVIYAGAASGYGGPDPAGWLVIDSTDEQGSGVFEYGHIIREVSVGDSVAAGQVIAYINPDSNTNGGVPPHVHVSVMPGGYDPSTKIDPMPWLNGALEPEGATPTMADTIFADVSEFQVPVDDSYPYRVLSIRSNDGTYRDGNFARNYQWCVRAVESGKLDFFIVYAYWRANWDQTAQTLIDMVEAQGGPHPKMVVMNDVESGGNPGGDQSDGINGFNSKIASWLGNPLRVIEYANGGDFRAMHNNRPAGLRIIGAGYGANPNLPGQIAHQYTDGQGYGGGLPEGAAPFGNCDMNSADGLDPVSFALACGIGSAPAPQGNAINDKAAEPASAWLGDRVTRGENVCPDGVGRFVKFTHGHVYWHPATGAHTISDALFARYGALGWEAGSLGYPTQDGAQKSGGESQAFQGGSLYQQTGKAVFVVWGLIGAAYIKGGAETGPLGWPVSDEFNHDDGKAQSFEHGTSYWAPSNIIIVPKG